MLFKNFMHSILKVIKGSLKYACYTLNYINSNPAEHVHLPRIDKINSDPAHIYTKEELERILIDLRKSFNILFISYSILYRYESI